MELAILEGFLDPRARLSCRAAFSLITTVVSGRAEDFLHFTFVDGASFASTVRVASEEGARLLHVSAHGCEERLRAWGSAEGGIHRDTIGQECLYG